MKLSASVARHQAVIKFKRYFHVFHLWLLLQVSQVSIDDFIDLMTSDSGPECLMWLPILHRLAAVENGTCFYVICK